MAVLPSMTRPRNAVAVQVLIPLGGYVSRSGNTSFVCSNASLFHDAFNGLFGVTGAYVAQLASPWNRDCQYLVSTLQFDCQRCSADTYTLDQGSSNGLPGNVSNPACLSCPLGGQCSGGAIIASQGHWGGGFPVVTFATCPSGYCCDSESSCDGVAPCSGNRQGPLCGDCAPGFVESVGSAACVSRSRCASDIPLAWALFAIGSLLAAVLLLVMADVWCPSRRPAGGHIRPLMYFLQMAQFVQIPAMSSPVAAAFEALLSVFRLQLPFTSSHPGLCASHHLTALLKVQLQGLIPFGVGAAMIVLEVARCALVAYLARRDALQPRRLSASVEARQYVRVGAASGDLDVNSSYLELDEHYADDAQALPLRSRWVSGAITLALQAYATFTSTTVKVLHCITLPGSSARALYLFIQGSVACHFGGWQAGYVLALALLCALVFPLPVVARWAMHASNGIAGLRATDLQLGFKRALVSSYKPVVYWWESVLLLHRLSLALLYAFMAHAPVIQSAMSVLICVLMFGLHSFVRPMRTGLVQTYQSALYLCLIVVALSRMFAASQLQLAVGSFVQQETRATMDVFETLTIVFGYVVPFVMFFAMFAVGCVARGSPEEK